MILLKKLEDLETDIINSDIDIKYEKVESELLRTLFNKKIEVIENKLNSLIDLLNTNFEMKLENFYSDHYELNINTSVSIEMRKNIKNINEIFFSHFHMGMSSPIGLVYDIKKESLSYDIKHYGGFSEFTQSSSSIDYKHMDKLIEKLNESINLQSNKELNTNLKTKIESLKTLHNFYYQNQVYKPKEKYNLFVSDSPSINIANIKEYIDIMCLKKDYQFQEKTANKKLKNK